MNINKPESNYLDLETAKLFQEKGISKWMVEKGVETHACFVKNNIDPFDLYVEIGGRYVSIDNFDVSYEMECKVDGCIDDIYFYNPEHIIPTFTLDQIISVLPEWVINLIASKIREDGQVFTIPAIHGEALIIYLGGLIDLHGLNFLKIFSEILIYLWDKNLLENK